MCLQFQNLTLRERPAVEPLLLSAPYRSCDYSPGGLFMWRDYFKVEYAFEDGVFYSRFRYPEEAQLPYYNMPLGGDTEKALRRIGEHCRAAGEPCRFSTVPEEALPILSSVFGDFCAWETREYFDYLYRLEDLTTLVGRRYNGQRNHLHKFEKAFPDGTFSPVTPADREELLAFFARQTEAADKRAPSALAEAKIVSEVLRSEDYFGMTGGVLRAGGQVVGFSFGEVCGDTLQVHVEKADRDVPGAYPTVVNRFCRLFEGSSVLYVNREDDTGDEGLRRSKESWHPLMLLKKYTVLIP